MEAAVPDSVIEVLSDRFGALEPIGAGAWATAFLARGGGRDLVVRVGEHRDDFEVDADMARHASDGLPIPAVIELTRLEPPHEDLHVCVSIFCPGEPLESVSSERWAALVPAVADLLEAMRAVSAPPDAPSWPETFFVVHDDDARLAGWRARLDALPEQAAAHRSVMSELGRLCELAAVAEVERTLLHCDLINRNVHVEGERISGVFDWGCRRWGDHLYDLAWFEFWAPWHPNLDVGLLRNALVARWGGPSDADRWRACLLHIGADHLIYNAAIDDPAGGQDVVERMRALGLVE
ncbi:MAG: aminoglycoside phosphotransferase family protein [Actinomycetota bacterium]